MSVEYKKIPSSTLRGIPDESCLDILSCSKTYLLTRVPAVIKGAKKMVFKKIKILKLKFGYNINPFKIKFLKDKHIAQWTIYETTLSIIQHNNSWNYIMACYFGAGTGKLLQVLPLTHVTIYSFFYTWSLQVAQL